MLTKRHFVTINAGQNGNASTSPERTIQLGKMVMTHTTDQTGNPNVTWPVNEITTFVKFVNNQNENRNMPSIILSHFENLTVTGTRPMTYSTSSRFVVPAIGA